MERIAIIDGVRTPIGNLGGNLKELTALQLSEIVTNEFLKRNPALRDAADEFIWGWCGQTSDAPNIARVVALKCGFPVKTPGFTVMRNCASGIQSIVSAVQEIKCADSKLCIVGGAESMSNIPYTLKDHRFGKRMRNSHLVDALWEGLTDPVCGQIMGRTAENLAAEFQVTREKQDMFAIESHRKAFRATREGKFRQESIPIEVEKRIGDRVVGKDKVVDDEGINVALNAQTLALYPTVFKESGTVTPGNSCAISDGAGVCAITTESVAQKLGIKPLGFIKSYAFAGVDPSLMGIGPAYATPIALEKAGLKFSDIQLVELNEAFAVQVMACQKLWKQTTGFDLPDSILNVNGGAIALGHPVGFTGIRIAVTILREMQRRNFKYGVSTLCVGGGQGAAVVLETV